MEDLKISDEDSGGCKPRGPVAWALNTRQLGLNKRPGVSQSIQEVAENKLIDKGSDHREELENLGRWEEGFDVINCQLGSTRSTFLMVFSPNRSLMASTHGDHNIYVTQTKTGKCIQTLTGHPRTPWCIEFHPSHKGVIASGCLGGQVRVWDLYGGSEMWSVEGVIASLTFHPIEKFLVIATYNELHFWDWEKSAPKLKITTNNEKEKVRYVKFDRLGHQLITGIANLNTPSSRGTDRSRGSGETPPDSNDVGGGGGDDPERRSGPHYHPLNAAVMDRYERLMQRYYRSQLDSANDRIMDIWADRDEPRYRRYSLLLDREDLDAPNRRTRAEDEAPRVFRPATVGRAHRASSRGRDGLPRVRLRRVPNFRDLDFEMSVMRRESERSRERQRDRERSREREREREHRIRNPPVEPHRENFRRELRERFLEMRRTRRENMRREFRGQQGADATGGTPAAESGTQDAATASSSFQHSSSSEFIQVQDPSSQDGPRLSRVLDIVGPPERTQDLVNRFNSAADRFNAVADEFDSVAEMSLSGDIDAANTSPGGQEQNQMQEPDDRYGMSHQDRMRRISRLSQTGVTIRQNTNNQAGISEDGVQRVTLSVGEATDRSENNNSSMETEPALTELNQGSGVATNTNIARMTNTSNQMLQSLFRSRPSRVSSLPHERSERVDLRRSDSTGGDPTRLEQQDYISLEDRFGMPPREEGRLSESNDPANLHAASSLLTAENNSTRDTSSRVDGAGLREFGPSTRRIDISLAEMSPPVSLPPVSVPLLTPTQIVDRMESRRDSSSNRSSDSTRSPLIHGDSTRSPLLGSETSRESSSLQPSRESSTLQPSRESSTLQTIRESSTLQPSRESSTPQTSRESSTQQANRESSAFLTSLDLSMASFAAREARRSPGVLESGRSPTRSIETGRSPGRSFDPSRSPGRAFDPSRSPGRAFDPEHTALRSRISRGRRSTADAPSSADRMAQIQAELLAVSGGNGGNQRYSDQMVSSLIQSELAATALQISDNPFTSRPPSSASEIEFDLPSQNSAVSSPVPRPLTARAGYFETGRSSVDTMGRNSADSAYRRSFSSDINQGREIPTPADVAAVEANEDDFASDSSSSRPSSRLERPDSRQNDGRRPESRQSDGRRPRLSMFMFHDRARQPRRHTLTRFMEEQAGLSAADGRNLGLISPIPPLARERSSSITSPVPPFPETVSRERATSASSAVTAVHPPYPGRSPRGDSDSTELLDIRDTDAEPSSPNPTLDMLPSNEVLDTTMELSATDVLELSANDVSLEAMANDTSIEMSANDSVDIEINNDTTLTSNGSNVNQSTESNLNQTEGSDSRGLYDADDSNQFQDEIEIAQEFLQLPDPTLPLESDDVIENPSPANEDISFLTARGLANDTPPEASSPSAVTDSLELTQQTSQHPAPLDLTQRQTSRSESEAEPMLMDSDEADTGPGTGEGREPRRQDNQTNTDSSDVRNPPETPGSDSRRHNLDISLLARHIEHMQRICRASLEDLPQSRQRRQVIRLQGIRRMLEDLHRQIRTLQSTVRGAVGASEAALAASEAALAASVDSAAAITGGGDGPSPPAAGGLDVPAEVGLDLTTPAYGGRRSDFTALRARRRVSPAPGRTTGILANRSRLTRAQNVLFSRLHATVRAMEMSPDLARRRTSEMNDSLTEASQSVMERHEQEQLNRNLHSIANRIASVRNSTSSRNRSSNQIPNTPSSGNSSLNVSLSSPGDIAELARNDLRSMSQRLERILRDRREAIESLDAPGSAEYNHREESGTEPDSRPLDLMEPLRLGLDSMPPLLLDSSTPSDSEDEFQPFLGDVQTPSRPGPPTRLSPFSRHSLARTSFNSRRDNLADFFDRESYLENRISRAVRDSSTSTSSTTPQTDAIFGPRPTTSRGETATARPAPPTSHHSSLSLSRGPRRYLDRIYRMRTAERFLEHRLRSYGSNQPPPSTSSINERLPPLSDLIWRRLRRRGDVPPNEEEETDDRDRNSRREAIREMVDQLTIDQAEVEEGVLGPAPGPVGPRRGAGAPVDPPAPHPPLHIPSSRTRMYQRLNRMSFMARFDERQRSMRGGADFHPLHSIPSSHLTHRIQTWDFWGSGIPDISLREHNVVVKEAKIHNDASVDISEDGKLLVTLAPCNLPMTTVVGLYSLQARNLGQVLATYSLESCAVSVSLSPTSRHLLVGLTSKTRVMPVGTPDRPLMAQVFRIKLPNSDAERGRLIHRRDINQVEQGHMSLNCIRWIPVAGQGLVFATNTGLLKILR